MGLRGRRRVAGKILAKIMADLLYLHRPRTREDIRIFLAASLCRKDDEIFGKKLRLARDGRTIQFESLGDRRGSFSADECQLARLFVRSNGRRKTNRLHAAGS